MSIPGGDYVRSSTWLSVLLFLAGCSTVRSTEDEFVVTTPRYAIALAVALGLVMLATGVLLLLGRLKPKGKPRALGVLAIIAGGSITFLVASSAPYERVVITPDHFHQRFGLLGRRQVNVDLRQVDRVVVYLADTFPRNHPRHSATPKHAFVEFVLRSGDSTHVRLRGWKWAPALEHLIDLCNQQGIELDDQREL